MEISYIIEKDGFKIYVKNRLITERSYYPSQTQAYLEEKAKEEVDRLLIDNGHKPKYGSSDYIYPFIEIFNPFDRMDRMGIEGSEIDGPEFFMYDINPTYFSQYSEMKSPSNLMFMKQDGSGGMKSTLTELNGVKENYEMKLTYLATLNSAASGNEVGKIFLQSNGERIHTIDIAALSGTSKSYTITYEGHNFDNLGIQMAYENVATGKRIDITNVKVEFTKK